MTESYTTARFWRCALQVNPYGYIAYRGKPQAMDAGTYNKALLEICLQEKIKVIGIANHGNVDGVDAIRAVMAAHDIVVFPGFEIASTEKVHFVCLFPEDTTAQALQRYLGALGLVDPSHGVWPSNLGGNDLITKAVQLGGFVYAAHATQDSGILTKNIPHVWMNKDLEAAQIVASLEDMKTPELNNYRLILENKNPDYKRDKPVAVINAKDVEQPETLKDPHASCLIKMTKPCFASFKAAFKDPESRVRLFSELEEVHHSVITSLRVTGGYLGGVAITFSDHLNAVIGGRGTGKSTLLECLRFVLDRRPIGKEAQVQHDTIIRANVGGKHRAHIEITVRSAHMGGRTFTISRRYGESPTIKDEAGKSTTLKPSDLLPGCEVYGQNEIHEIAKNVQQQGDVLARFLNDQGIDAVDAIIAEIHRKLTENRKRILDARRALADMEDEVSKLPALQERVKQFKELGLEQRLRLLPLLEKERQLAERVATQEGPELDQAFVAVRDLLPDPTFLSEAAIETLPHKDTLRPMREALQRLGQQADQLLKSWATTYASYSQEQGKHLAALAAAIKTDEAGLEKLFSQIPAAQGKSGRQIGMEFQQLIKDIERIRPKQAQVEQRLAAITSLAQERSALLAELSKQRAQVSSLVNTAIKRLNRKLDGKLRLQIVPESQRGAVVQFLLGCALENTGEGKLGKLCSAEDFSPIRLVELIRQGEAALRGSTWGITPSVAQALLKLEEAQLLELQEIDMTGEPVIELNVNHAGEPLFKPLTELSTGQQCTAILHLLLLDNKDPLILDQPEDNLDNAFIADRIVTTLRQAKLQRQFIFATHNANIPVFGDAEWIGVLEADNENAHMPPDLQGAIDQEPIRDRAAVILEGGKEAFTQRREKYGYP